MHTQAIPSSRPSTTMGNITVTRRMQADPDAIWQVWNDFGNVFAWNSNVVRSRTTNGIATGVGAERKCDFDAAGKNWVRERVTEQTADATHISIYDTNAPLKELEVDVRVQPSRTGTGSLVTFEAHMTPKFGLLGRALEAVAIRPSFRKSINGLLVDLDAAALRTVKA